MHCHLLTTFLRAGVYAHALFSWYVTFHCFYISRDGHCLALLDFCMQKGFVLLSVTESHSRSSVWLNFATVNSRLFSLSSAKVEFAERKHHKFNFGHTQWKVVKGALFWASFRLLKSVTKCSPLIFFFCVVKLMFGILLSYFKHLLGAFCLKTHSNKP